MGGSIKEVIQDNRITQKLIATVDLTLLSDAKRNSVDPEVKQEASDAINAVYQAQADADALTERIKSETVADLESKHVERLLERSRLEDELKTLNLKGYEFRNEQGKVNGRLQVAHNRLSEHQSAKQKWIPALLLPATKVAWETKLVELQSKVDEILKDKANLNLEISEYNEELSVLANRIRTATADALYLYNRISRLKGSVEPIMDRATGLAR